MPASVLTAPVGQMDHPHDSMFKFWRKAVDVTRLELRWNHRGFHLELGDGKRWRSVNREVSELSKRRTESVHTN